MAYCGACGDKLEPNSSHCGSCKVDLSIVPPEDTFAQRSFNLNVISAAFEKVRTSVSGINLKYVGIVALPVILGGTSWVLAPKITQWFATDVEETPSQLAMAIEPVFGDVGAFKDGLAPALSEDKWGYVNNAGEFQIEPNFEEALAFEGDFGAIQIAGKWGLIDRSGETVIEPKFDLIFETETGLFQVQLGEKAGLLRRDGSIALSITHSLIGGFTDDRAQVSVDGKHGFIDKTGKVVVPLKFRSAQSFSDGLAIVSADGQLYGAIDTNGAFVIPPEFSSIQRFSEGLAIASKSGKNGLVTKGYINLTGAFEIDLSSSGIEPFGDFVDGIAVAFSKAPDRRLAVDNGARCGYIDKSGNFTIEPQYFKCDEFHHGIAAVVVEKGTGQPSSGSRMIIDRNGEPLVQETFDLHSEIRFLPLPHCLVSPK